MIRLMPLHPKTPSSLASFKPGLVLPFWYHLTHVVLEKRPLNSCSRSSTYCQSYTYTRMIHTVDVVMFYLFVGIISLPSGIGSFHIF